MTVDIEEKCKQKGVKLTDQRKLIAKVMSDSKDHPDVDELYKRVSKIDSKISIATIYRTVKLFEESGILTKHDFRGGKARYEELSESHHDHYFCNQFSLVCQLNSLLLTFFFNINFHVFFKCILT